MSVVSVVITGFCTVHASDSFITEIQGDGSRKILESEKSKIISVPPWRGAIAYWGLAVARANTSIVWSTMDWLEKQVSLATSVPSPEDFAQLLARNLHIELSKLNFAKPTDVGIGMHFTAYEWVSDYWIPELFLISNWTNPSYRAVHPTGPRVSREAFGAAFKTDTQPEHREETYRLKVHGYLQEGKWLIYNNGDPTLFNPAANSILGMAETLAQRGTLSDPEQTKTYQSFARLPVEIVSKVQHDFCKEGSRIVGGKPHDLAITSGGEYSSTSGDA